MIWELRGNIRSGGSGPNPVDSYRFRIAIAESLASQIDAMKSAFAFPENNNVLTDALLVGVSASETNAALIDSLFKVGVFIGDLTSSPIDTLNLSLQFLESNLVLNDVMRVSFLLDESNISPSDMIKAKIIYLEDNAIETDAAAFAVQVLGVDNNVSPSEGVGLSFTRIETMVIQPMDEVV